MNILIEERILRPVEDNSAREDAGGWSQGTSQNCAVPWWLPRTAKAEPCVYFKRNGGLQE